MNEEINFKELRERLSTDDIKRILSKYDAYAVVENEKYLIFPTICHNIVGGSNKLYYYTDTHLFKCYTQCDGVFDIFELLQKIHKLRGHELSIFSAIQLCGLKTDNFLNKSSENTVEQDIKYLYNLLKTKQSEIKLPTLDKQVLNRFIFDMKALKIWQLEGISYNTMLKYKISYDPINNCIIIPNFDVDNNLISVRGRYFEGDAKYKPIVFGDKVLSHPSAMNLYGLNVSKQAIERSKKVIVYEGEKSVLKMDSIYDDNNNSVATLGKNISNQQIQMLKKWGVKEIILAYDADYRNYEEMAAKRNEYKRIAQPLKTYFNVSLMLDMDMDLLDYKDSPIDKGQEVFEKIYKNRLFI